ncbi:MAG: hypothetical protein HQ556_05800 [Candidatus Marinimicrobia bacterium]|nr:hypothetical protein [Candidatus Neomarinimicrobiota bacterium]
MIEIIELRCESTHIHKTVEQLRQILKGMRDAYNNTDIVLYRHTNIQTDYAIHIKYELTKPSDSDSSLSISLRHLLQDIGLTHHSSWTEISTLFSDTDLDHLPSTKHQTTKRGSL